MRPWIVQNVWLPFIWIGAAIGMPQAIIWARFFPPKEAHPGEAGMIYGLALGFKMFLIDVGVIAALVGGYFIWRHA